MRLTGPPGELGIFRRARRHHGAQHDDEGNPAENDGDGAAANSGGDSGALRRRHRRHPSSLANHPLRHSFLMSA
ncbi:hypothetical protein AWC09_04275 [Mycolicibacter hiberniae]|nr:hypothetical protein AWC09_04275 [Mycolicibacter hiberniae]